MSTAILAAPGETTATDFFMKHGRLPAIGDPVAPWHYRAWLLPYAQQAESLLALKAGRDSRWEYYLDCVADCALPKRPLPPIRFTETAASRQGDAPRQAWKLITAIEERNGFVTGLSEFIRWLGYGLGVSKERPNIDDNIQETLYREFNIGPWLERPYDYPGDMLAERRSGSRWNNPNAFYPTPHEVAHMMALMTMANCQVGDTVCDPAVGTGRMLLEASNYSLRLYGCDIDPLCCLVTRINGALYAPWLAFGAPDAWFAQPGGVVDELLSAAQERHPEAETFHLVNRNGQGLLFGDLEPLSADGSTKRKKGTR